MSTPPGVQGVMTADRGICTLCFGKFGIFSTGSLGYESVEMIDQMLSAFTLQDTNFRSIADDALQLAHWRTSYQNFPSSGSGMLVSYKSTKVQNHNDNVLTMTLASMVRASIFE